MMRSLFSGVAGLKTHQQKMDVIGNNIANVNTTAFKSTSTTFQDVMYQTMSNASGGSSTKGGVNARQIGLGVTTGANKISISTQGSSEATGDGLDLRLVDAQSTNFFVVSDGTQNLFTRAGSFYVDGNGNLAMTSTGYLVQGWQVDSTTGNIKKDTVSALRVMDSANLTSDPEETTQAYASGIIDSNDSNVTSTSGHIMSLTFYDNLGYAYTAKFSVKSGEDSSDGSFFKKSKDTSTKSMYNGFTIELESITSDSQTDSEGNPIDILDQYINNQKANNVTEIVAKANLFGTSNGMSVDSFKLDSSKYTIEHSSQSGYLIVSGTGTKAMTAMVTSITSLTTKIEFSGNNTTTSVDVTSIFSGLDSASNNYTGKTVTVDFDPNTQSLKVKTNAAAYDLLFNSSNGTFGEVAARNASGATKDFENQGTAVKLHVKELGNQFPDDISIDFSTLLNYDNGGSSTAGLDRGTASDASKGAGKKIGQITGLTIQENGQIFASYSNGNTQLLGQIPVARFANASGLESVGSNCYKTTLNSGSFDGIGKEVSSDGSKMNSGYLEMSNVDLAQEFTQMITTQRGFQANSRIITVSDTMLEELTNLKR